MSERGKGIGVANWVVSKASGFFDARLSRRSFIARTTLLGSAVAATGLAACTQQGSSYTRVTDCSSGLCRDGYTEFCCVINKGQNKCPSGTIAAGWWRADGSPYCSSGTRYYIDCNETCCGPTRSDGFCSGCSACRCAVGCDTRRVHCNYFRYGQCNSGTRIGPIACRMVSCTPPYNLGIGCSPSGAVDNATARHFADCAKYTPPPPPPPTASVLPLAGAIGIDDGGAGHLFTRFNDGTVRETHFDGSAWTAWQSLGNGVTSGIACETFAGKLFVITRRTSKQDFWYSTFDGTTWSAFASMGGVLFSDPATAVVNGYLFVFAEGGDGNIYFNRNDGTAWSGWTRLQRNQSSTASVAVLGTQLFVFTRENDYALWYRRLSAAPNTWDSRWVSLKGVLTSDPCAVTFNSGINVFVRGGNNGLYMQRYNGSSWAADFTSVPQAGAFASDPVAVVFANKIWVFGRTSSSDLRYLTYDGSSWSSVTVLGSGVDTDPVARVIGGQLYLQADSTSNTSLLWIHDGTNWGSVQDLGGTTAPVRARA